MKWLEKRICPVCSATGLKSKVFYKGSSTSGFRGAGFWDENGDYHNHESPDTRSLFMCSNKHMWEELEEKRCPTCDWFEAKKIKIIKGEEMKEKKKSCLSCYHFTVEVCRDKYSELIKENVYRIYCNKEVWDLSDDYGNESTLRAYFSKAEECYAYENIGE